MLDRLRYPDTGGESPFDVYCRGPERQKLWEPRDPRFLRIYGGDGTVILVAPDGKCSPAFRVYFDEDEQQAWMREQLARLAERGAA